MCEVRKEDSVSGSFLVSFVRVDSESAGQRLDNFLIRLCKGVPKSHIYRIVRGGEVRVDGKRAQVSARLEEGSVVRIPPIRLPQPAFVQKGVVAAARHYRFEVLFEDEFILAIAKPPGLAVHGGSGIDFGVIEALRLQRPDAPFLELAHRLDRDTSGILLIGKKRSALKQLHNMFRQSEADKRYLALVAGEWTDNVKDVRLPLDKYLTEDGERRVSVNGESGRFAHSIFRLMERGRDFSLVEAQIKTGRTHQIRVHLSHLGFPIAGDDKYGDFALNKSLMRNGLKRMFLHAWRIRFSHPSHGGAIALEAELPSDLVSFYAALKGRVPVT